MAQKIAKVHNIYDLIDLIRLRPGLYIGDEKISTMATFLNGYQFASLVHTIEGENVFPPFWYFHEWAMHTYGWGESTSDWANIILTENDRDEKKALRVFFDLVDEFKTLKPLSIQGIKLNASHMDFYLTKSSRANTPYREAPYDKIDDVLLVHFSHNFGYSHFLIRDQKVVGLDWRTRYKTEADAKSVVEFLFGPLDSWEDLQGDLKTKMEQYL